MLGLYSGSSIKYRHGQLDVTFEDRKDDLLRGLAGRRVRFRDESYWRLTGSTDQIELLATCAEEEEEGKELAVPMIWNRQIGKGRIHVNILGHYNWTFNDPVARIIFLRGIAWAAGEPVDRFASLATIDVDMSAASAPAR